MREFLRACWPSIGVALLGVIGLVLSPLFLILTFFMAFDAYRRWEDYLRLKKVIDKRGPSNIYLRARRGSFCKRVTALVAFETKGHKAYALRYYYRRGYRWWHFFPEGSFCAKSTILSYDFWLDLVDRRNYVRHKRG